ncbi:hypothetical protein MKW92_044475 [Papaver armeniacum]|nr:hypothetical protein MKW92_044475 [Papaver armeniacum]
MMKNEVKDIMYRLYKATKSRLRSIATKEIKLLKQLLSITDPEERFSALATAFSPGDEKVAKDSSARYTYVRNSSFTIYGVQLFIYFSILLSRKYGVPLYLMLLTSLFFRFSYYDFLGLSTPKELYKWINMMPDAYHLNKEESEIREARQLKLPIMMQRLFILKEEEYLLENTAAEDCTPKEL